MEIESKKLSIVENNLIIRLSKWFNKVGKEIQENIDLYYDDLNFQLQVDLILSPIHTHQKEYVSILSTAMLEGYKIGYHIGEIQVNDEITKMVTKAEAKITRTDLFGTSEKVKENLEERAFNASQSTLSRVDNSINNILAEGYSTGAGSKLVGQKIQKQFNALESWEAKRIARTEIHSTHVEGMIQGYNDLDVQYYRWNAHIDNRTRDSHRDNLGNRGGQIIPAGGTFSNGLKYPGDKSGPIKEWVNCRCTVSPFLMPLDKIAPVGKSYFYEDELVTITTPPTQEFKPVKVFDEERFNNLKSNEDVADFFGLEYNPNGQEFKHIGGKSIEFYDSKNKVTIRIFTDDINKVESLDLTNTGKANVNLKDFIKAYSDAPENLKKSSGVIDVMKGDAHSPMGECWQTRITLFESTFSENNMIHSTRKLGEYGKTSTIETNLWHEMTHALEESFIKFDKGEHINVEDIGSQQLRKRWAKATKQDYEFQIKKGIEKQDSTRYGEEKHVEDFAEFGSLIHSYETSNNSSIMYHAYPVRVPYNEGHVWRRQTISEIVEANPNRSKLMKELLYETDVSTTNKEIEMKRYAELLAEL